MEDSRADNDQSDERDLEAYTVGYESAVVDFFASRGAARQAAFFRPYLEPGLSLLDCGCGPGGITLDLAEIVAPAEVVGIDIEPSQIERGRALARKRGIGNARFEVASVYELPFADGSFDRVFVHGVLEHLREPIRALREIRRVLRSGGALGTRHADLGGHLMYPSDPPLELFFCLYGLVSRDDGGNPDFGRAQLTYLREAGFERLATSASYDCWTETPETRERLGGMMIEMLTRSRLATRALELGLTDRAELARAAKALAAWRHDPAAFAAEAWCEAVAWKEG